MRWQPYIGKPPGLVLGALIDCVMLSIIFQTFFSALYILEQYLDTILNGLFFVAPAIL